MADIVVISHVDNFLKSQTQEDARRSIDASSASEVASISTVYYDTSYSLVQSSSASWVAGMVQDDIPVSTKVRASSAGWNNTSTTVNSNSGKWNIDYLPLTGGNLTGALSTNSSGKFLTLSATTGMFTTSISAASYLGLPTYINDDTSVSTKVRNTSAGWDSNYTTTNSNSANWNSVSTKLRSSSAAWDSTYTTVSSNSAGWNNTTTTVNSNSAGWNNVSTKLRASSAYWDSTYTTVSANSAGWNNVYTTTNSNSANWNSVSTKVRASSSAWDSNYTTTNSNSAGWNNTTTTVNSNSATWGGSSDDTSVSTKVRASSSAWDSSYTTVNSNSAVWGVLNTVSVSAASTSFTIDSTHSGKIITYTSSLPMTALVTTGIDTLGFNVTVAQLSTGSIKFVTNDASVLVAYGGLVETAGKGAIAAITNVASSTYLITGILQ